MVAPPPSNPQGPSGTTADAFDLPYVVKALHRRKMIDIVQAKEIISREGLLRQRVLTQLSVDQQKYDVSPIELVEAHGVPVPLPSAATL